MKGLRPFPFLGMGLVLCVLMTACGGRAPQNGPSGLFVATSTLQNGVVGDTYSQTLFATGGLPPYTWSIDSGSLPVGLSLSSSGVIAGTTTVAGDSAFTVRVTDSQSPTKAYNTAYLTITVNPALTLPPTNLPNGTIGVAYSQAVAATGGLKPYIYSLAPNSAPLPSGLTLGNDGTITGTPTGPTGTTNFTVQVTDALSNVATGNFSITVVGKLQGNYAFSFNGYNNGQPFYVAGSFIADGNGNIVSGVFDRNGTDSVGVMTDVPITAGTGGTAAACPLTGGSGSIYCIDTNNLGTLNLVSALGTYTFQFSVSLVSDTRFILADPNNPNVYGSGVMKKQNPVGVTLTGTVSNPLPFTFGFFGVDSGGNRYAGAGTFATDGQGNLVDTSFGTPPVADTNDNSSLQTQVSLTGTLSMTVDPATGRGTMTLTLPTGTQNYAIYAGVGAKQNEIMAVQIDAVSSGAAVTLASILNQNGAGGITGQFSNASLNANSSNPAASAAVLELNAVSNAGGTLAPDVSLGLATFTSGSGSVASYALDENTGGTLAQVNFTGATYNVATNGRVTLTGLGTYQPVWYLAGSNTGFVIGTDPSVTFGSLEPQTLPPPYNNLAIFGNFYGGTVTPVLPSVTNEVDSTQVLPPNSTWTSTYDSSGTGGVQLNQMLNATYCISDPSNPNACLAAGGTNNTSRILIQNGASTVDILYIVSGGAGGATNANTKVVSISTDKNPRLTVLVH